MQKIQKKAYKETQKYYIETGCDGIRPSSSWENVYVSLCNKLDLEGSIYTGCKSTGDTTKFSVSYVKTGKPLVEFQIPNSDAYIDSEQDWNWNYIYMIFLEWGRKTKLGKRKSKIFDKYLKSINIKLNI